jgi:SET and MYND domain-containing protein
MGSGTVSVDEVIRNAAEVVAGLQELLIKGHPIRGIAITELGKLFCVDEPASTGETNEKATFPPRGYRRLSLAKDTLIQAKDEVEIGFGPGGGDLGAAIRRLLENTDREMKVFRKGVKNLQATASK